MMGEIVMNHYIILSILFFILLFLCKLKYFNKNNAQSIPMVPTIPFSLPIIGHLLYLTNKPYEKLLKWSNKYGNIYEIQLGSNKAIVLNSTNVIRDALIKSQDTFSNRPDLFMLKQTLKGLGIISSNYTTSCIENRNLVMAYLHKTLKFKTTNLEPYINNSIDNYLNELILTNKNKQINSNDFKINIHYILVQRMLIFLYGLDCENKQQLISLVKKVDENFKNTRITSMFNFVPVSRFLKSSIFKNVKAVNDFLSKLTKDKINQHESCMNDDDDTFVDAYLEKIKFNRNIFNFEQLSSLVQDLFLSSTETLSNAIIWSLVYIAYYQNYQKKVHEEIDASIGKQDKPSYEYAKLTPFIIAFIRETIRFQCAGPVLIPRSTLRDTLFHNYYIPKDTMILVNMYSCMRDPMYWYNPNEFDPMRFIDKNGSLKLDNPAYLPFSAGKRFCLGEELAKTELYLIFTSILQRLHLNLVNKPKSISELFNYGMNLSPKNVLFEFEFR